jgi:hypothetical protein
MLVFLVKEITLVLLTLSFVWFAVHQLHMECSSPTSPCRYGAVAVLSLQKWSRFAALVVAIVGNTSSWISGNFLRVIELLRAVQKNSLVYSKQKTLLHGQYPELKFILYTGQLQGPKFCTCYLGRRL